jgi:hypothetical protein
MSVGAEDETPASNNKLAADTLEHERKVGPIVRTDAHFLPPRGYATALPHLAHSSSLGGRPPGQQTMERFGTP